MLETTPSISTDQNKKIYLPITDNAIKSFIVETPRNLTDESIRLIDKTYGKGIRYWAGDSTVETRILQEIYAQGLDDGVLTTHTYKDAHGEIHTEEGHAILNRKAMLTELKKKVGFRFDETNQDYKIDEGKNFKILPLDLQNFREADLQGAGDYDLNIFTRQLNIAIEKIAKELNIDTNDIIVGRYGGDEFYIVIIENKQGKVNPLDEVSGMPRKIKKIVIDTVQTAKGYFGEDKPMPFTVKDADKVDYINIDDDPISKLIYLNSLNEALVLGTEELLGLEGSGGEREYVKESVKKDIINNINDPKKRRELLKFLGKNNGSSYPSDYLLQENTPDGAKALVKKKMEYLIKGHDELRLPYILAQNLDEIYGGNRVGQLLDFYQGNLIDPLLKEINMTRMDLFSHIKRGEFTKIYAFEIKMKEINDYMSYVYGDRIIRKFWDERFKSKLRPLIEKGKIKVGRIGGEIVVCETGKDGGLSQKERGLLDSPGLIELDFKGKKEAHEIGYAVIEVPKEVVSDENIYKNVIVNIFDKPSQNWLEKSIKRIINNNDEFVEFIKTLKNKEYKSKDFITYISARYFDSKRAKNRLSTAFQVLDKLRHSGLDINLQLRIEEILIEIMQLNNNYTGERNFTAFNTSFKSKHRKSTR